MEQGPRVPDFLVLGAPKCGTTTVAALLDRHPDLHVAPGKEVRFFNVHRDRGLEWYAERLTRGARPGQLVGEATPSYLYLGERLADLRSVCPDARLVVVLREPVSRAWSNYWFLRSIAVERRTWRQAFGEELRDPSATVLGTPVGYVSGSDYTPHLRAVIEVFGREPVLVLLDDDLRGDPDGSWRRLCAHLGVRDDLPRPEVGDRNVGGAPRSFQLQRLAAALGRGRVRSALTRLNTRPGGYPRIDPELEHQLHRRLDPSTADLPELIGRELPPSWRP